MHTKKIDIFIYILNFQMCYTQNYEQNYDRILLRILSQIIDRVEMSLQLYNRIL